MQLAVWIGFCLAGAFVLRTHMRAASAGVLVLWLLVPAVGSSVVTGVVSGPLSFHAATWLVLSMLAVRLLDDPVSVQAVLGRHFILFLILTMVILAAFLASRTSDAGGGMVLLVDQIVVPVLFFLILLSAARSDPGLIPWLRAVLMILVALVCAIALFQWLTHSVIFYESGYLTQYWYSPETDRWMGTLDQPLALSLAISMAAPMVAGLRNNGIQAVLLILMIVGVLITQSRVGLFVLAFSLVAVVAFAKRRIWVRIALLAVLAVAVWAIMASPLIAGVAARLEDDTGSAEARGRAFEYFLAHWGDYFIAGQGIGSSYRIAVQGGLQTSFENPMVMYSVDFGIVFAVLYFSSMAVLVLRNATRHHYRGLTLAGILAVAVPQTYSSLGTRSAAGILVWTVLAMIVIAGDEAIGRRESPVMGRLPAAAARSPVRIPGS